jgi:iron complex outermembrane receptor protein
MKLIAGCLFTVLFACVYNSTFAQTNSSAIHGKVLTGQTTPADGATVVLLQSGDSTVVKSTISDKAGAFRFNDLQPGIYLVFITRLNYSKLYSGPYQVTKGADIDAGMVTLGAKISQLSGVSITGKKDFVEIRPDKTVLNVDRNIMASGASLYDVLRSAPGVKIVNDEILLRGGQKALIAINGKPVLLSGDELINLLRSYQSNSVSQIELIDNSSVKYDAASGGMINIILKKNKNIGSNMIITEGVAYGNKYKLNTGINWDLRTSKLNIFASYNFADNKTIHNFSNERIIDQNNFNVNYNAATVLKGHTFNLGGDYMITPKHTVGILFNGFDNVIDINKDNITNIGTNGLPDSSIHTQSDIDRHIVNLNYNVNYRGNFGSSGKSTLSADINYTTYRRHSSELLENAFYNASGQADGRPLFYNDYSPSSINIRSENIDFGQVLSKSSNLDIGIKNSQVNSDNTIDFKQLINNQYVPVPELTDHFIYKERINAAYIRYNGKFGKAGLSVGLRAEQTNSSAFSVNQGQKIDSSYFSLFPNIQLTYDPDNNNQLTLFYSRNVNRPNYQDMNPFVGYVDQFFYNTGNPFLKPAYINTFQASDLYLHKYKITLSAAITNNFFSTIFQQDDITKVYITIKDNIATRYRYAAQFDLPFDLTKWWNMNIDFSLVHDHYAYFAADVDKKSTNALEGNISQNFNITSKLSAQLEGVYQSPTYYVISQYKVNYYLNAGLRYSLFKNGSISLTARDIFNTDIDNLHSNYRNLDITQRDKLATRFIMATFTYRFGSSSAKGRSNTTDEQRRLGGSTNEN